MPFTFSENSQGTTWFTIICFFQVFSFVAVILRLWGRRLQKTALQLNDYAILAALTLNLANLALLGVSVRYGLGLRITRVMAHPEDLVIFIKVQLAFTVMWEWAVFAIKISILDLYIKLFRVSWFVKVCYGWIIFQALFILSCFLSTMLLCRPFRYQWDRSIDGKCGDLLKSYYATHIIILLTDVITAVLPIPILWNLNMSIRKKVGICAMFALGTLIVTFNIIRLAWTDKVKSLDITYDHAVLFGFSELETQLGVILASVPLTQAVLRKYLGPGFLGGSRTGKSSDKSGGAAYPMAPRTIGSSRNRKYNNITETETESARGFDLETEDNLYNGGHSTPDKGEIVVMHNWDVRHEDSS